MKRSGSIAFLPSHGMGLGLGLKVRLTMGHKTRHQGCSEKCGLPLSPEEQFLRSSLASQALPDVIS